MPTINNVPVTQYIGPKIVPHFASPAEWSIDNEYDALSIVTNNGNTYWAKYNVPSGIDISNTEYWYLSAYPDAQIQAYRQEVMEYAETVESFDSRISANTSDISTLEALPNNALTEAVFIGDSFTSAHYLVTEGASEKDRWCYFVANDLHVNPHIYAERGAGYIRNGNIADGGHNFRAMLDIAANDSSFSNSNVKYVFVYGGLNDLDHENAQTAFTSTFSAFCIAARRLFPQATIVICGINAWPEGFSLYQYNSVKRGQIFYEYTMHTQSGFNSSHCIFISMCGALGFNADYYYSNNRHPNVEGNRKIATWIINAMNGGDAAISKVGNFFTEEDPDTTAGTITLHMLPGIIEASGVIPRDMNDKYISDTFNLFLDQAIDLRGTPLIIEPASGQTIPTLGYLGAKNENSFVHVVNNGFFRFVRVF